MYWVAVPTQKQDKYLICRILLKYVFEVHNEYRGSFNRYLVLAWIGTCYPQIRCQVFESPFSCHNFDYIIREIAI